MPSPCTALIFQLSGCLVDFGARTLPVALQRLHPERKTAPLAPTPQQALDAWLGKSATSLQLQALQQTLSEQTTTPFDVIIEASGSMAALRGVLNRLASNAAIVLLGYYDEVSLPYMPLFLAQAKLLTAKEWAPGDLVRCRDLIASGALDVGTLLTHTCEVHDIRTAYEIALHDARCLKLLLTWTSA